jgi:protein SCO1/2
MLTMQMAALQKRMLATDVRFVSFCVDPETDSPARLRDYAKNHHANLETWSFVTGEREVMRNLIVRGFKLGLGEPVKAQDTKTYDIMHARYFVLVDRKGVIRGYYPSDQDGMTRLEHDAKVLAELRP